MFDTIERARLNDLHVCHDENSGLKAIIAIHNTRLGPALGGCRTLHYVSEQAAFDDAIKLARSMSYKAALAGLNQGGGKAVIMLPEQDLDREKIFKAFGNFVEKLGGRYITAVDSGTELTDLDIVARQTEHVVGTGNDGYDPSPMTARGVLAGITASVRHRLNRQDVSGLRVIIQGVGHVGGALARLLTDQGAHLQLNDSNQDRAQQLAKELGASCLSTDAVYGTECDVFSPCALGGILNPSTIAQLQCKIVAGSANNQLHSPADGQLLKARNILYAPDYLINSGGLIRLSLVKNGKETEIDQHIDSIGEMLERIYQLSEEESLPTNDIADRMAEKLLYD